ncbi:MAG: ABC transporter substrate-binding protein [Gammaproteobacteria bacterium]
MGMPPSQGNPFGAVGPPSSTVWLALFDGLTQLDDDGKLAPGLALKWDAIDRLTWRFDLRPDVHFSNGNGFSAAAVVRLVNWMTSQPGRASLVGNELRNVAGAEALDELTVLIRTSEPDAILPRRLSAMLVVEPDTWEQLGPNGFGGAPVGTGPYYIEDWNRSANTLIAKRNPYGWRQPNINEIHFIALIDQSVRLQALLSGDIDLAIIGLEGLDQLRERGYRLVAAPGMSVMAIAIVANRSDSAPTTDVRVRQALNYAIDRQAIAKNILGRPEQAAGQPAARGTFGHDPGLLPFPYDPDKARSLLVEAGYPDGFDFVLDVVVDATAGDADIYQMVAQYLNEVGVRTTLRVRLFSAWLRDYMAGSWTSDAFSLAWNAAPYNDVQRPMEYYSCARPVPFFCDQTMSAKLSAAAGEFDVQKREALLQELSRDYRQAAPAIFLVEQVMTWGATPRVDNLSIANRVYQYDKITFRGEP